VSTPTPDSGAYDRDAALVFNAITQALLARDRFVSLSDRSVATAAVLAALDLPARDARIAAEAEERGWHRGFDQARRYPDPARDARTREETHQDIARQLEALAADAELISAWTLTCDPVPLTVADWFLALASKLRAPAVRPVEPSAVPVEGSGHPRPFVECLLPVADDWCVSPTGHDDPCSPTRPILSLDTPEGATANDH
jgi:hypothetical protein